jgi:3-isopropylmalate/(R)-2-methylmalate dehydratase small subunit
VDGLFTEVFDNEGYQLSVDLPKQVLTKPDGGQIPFAVDSFRKHCLINGLDDIGLTLQHVEAIKRYEQQQRETSPWLFY